MFEKITRRSLDRFLAPLATEARVLDIGSGGSSYERYFPNRLTVDIDPARKPEVIADAHQLPFDDACFERVLCTEVLEHLTDPARAIAEMYRVLAPGGMLILSTRFVYPLHDAPHDYFRYTRFGLEHLFREWHDVQIVPEVSTMATIGVLVQRIAFQSEVRGGKVTKAFLLILAELFTHLDWLLVREYGDIRRSSAVSGILSSGYFVTAQK